MRFFSKQFKEIESGGIRIFIKKLFIFSKFLIRLPLFIYGFLVCTIFKLLSPLVKIKVQNLPAENFGDFVYLSSLYYIKKKILKHKDYNSIDLLYVKVNSNFYNKQIQKMIERKFTILPSLIIDPVFQITNFFKIFNDLQISLFSNKPEYDEDNLFERYKSIEFTDDEIKKGDELLKKFGLKKGQKFVCLAVRDEEFSKLKSKNIFTKNIKSNSFRNWDIENFKKVAEFCANKGLVVFRMGKSVNKKISINNPLIIDYANSAMKNDFLDVYLGANCQFCISTGYGFDAVPYVFNKPIALATIPIGDFRAHSKRIFFLTKKHYDTSLSRNLTLKEIFAKNLAFSDTIDDFINKNIKLIEPSSDELRDFIIEFYNKIYKNGKFNNDEIKLQEVFKNKYLEYFKLSDYPNKREKYYVNIHKNFFSYFSTDFLKKNDNWLV